MCGRGLAYRPLAPVHWCPKDQPTLAREEVVGEERVCERCGTPVIKKNLEQWFLKITAYADELLDFSGIEWPDRVRTLQENWIGKSLGVEFELKVQGHPGVSFRVFTTRPDTVYGMTCAVLAPEHPLVDQLTTPDRRADVEAYKFKAARQSDIERLSTEKERDGWARIADSMEQRGIGQRKASYRLHDWLISRQRYWGTPIPIIYCSHCGTVPVPESDLPVRLPEDAEFLPTGESPLKLHEGFRRARCPQCGGGGERGTRATG